MNGAAVIKQTYRQWVEEGARGFFLTSGVAVNPVRLINPLDRRGGFFVRRDMSDPRQQERRAQLALGERDDGERVDRRQLARERAEQGATHSPRHRHVLAYDSAPTPDAALDAPALAGTADGTADGEEPCERVPWIVTARIERAAEVVRRGWLTWETEGEVVAPATAGESRQKE